MLQVKKVVWAGIKLSSGICSTAQQSDADENNLWKQHAVLPTYSFWGILRLDAVVIPFENDCKHSCVPPSV
eukprot:35630-Pelagomonas_calceolata.AAC.1